MVVIFHFYELKHVANYTINKLILHKQCERDFDNFCVVTGNKGKLNENVDGLLTDGSLC